MATNELLADLVEDLECYPRQSVDDVHISRLSQALRAGATLPPIIADTASRRIVDGVHRRRAFLSAYGPTAEGPVEWQSYPSEGALLLDAIRRNAAHGLPFSAIDLVRSIVRAEARGIEPDVVRSSLSLTPERYATLRSRVADVAGIGVVELKQPLAHLAGATLTPSQWAANRGVSGSPIRSLVRQLIRHLNAETLDTTDMATRRALEQLYEAAGAWLTAHPAVDVA